MPLAKQWKHRGFYLGKKHGQNSMENQKNTFGYLVSCFNTPIERR